MTCWSINIAEKLLYKDILVLKVYNNEIAKPFVLILSFSVNQKCVFLGPSLREA